MMTICISLMEQPERKEKAKQHFAEMGVDNVVFYEGLNAEKMGFNGTNPYMLDRKEGDELFYIGTKPTGIFLSHYSLWSALTLLPDEHFFILEIDAQFTEGWKEKFEQALKDVPDYFDWLFAGSCCCDMRHKTHVKGDIWDIRWPMCFHAYVVAKKALPHLLATNRNCYAPIDISTTLHSFNAMNVFTVYPRIVNQFDTEIPI